MQKARMPLSSKLVDGVTRYSPWLAPIPTAAAIFRAGLNHLAWPWPVALAAALLVEGLGLATSELALDMYSHNRGRQPSEPAAPTWLAALTVGVYLAAAVLLAVLIDVYPVLVRWITAVFPLVGLCGYLTLALRKDHDRRLQHTENRAALDLEYERKDRDLALENRRLDAEARRRVKLLQAERKGYETPNTQSVTPDVTPTTSSVTRREALRVTLQGGDVTPNITELARQFGVSRATIYQDLEKIRSNGHGGGHE